jgi:Trk K+ transport system NAD-binding subunit
LQAALAVAGNQDPAIGYSVAYPFGVVGPIVLMTAMAALVKPRFAAPLPSVRLLELTVGSACEGRTVGEVSATLPDDVKIVAVRHDQMNAPPVAETTLRAGDGLLLVGSPPSLERTTLRFGREQPGLLSRDRADYDVVRVYVSRAAFVGKPLGAIALPEFPIMISHVRRGDAQLLASSDLVIEFGDRLVMAVPVGRQTEVRRFFGDSIRGNAEMSFVSVGVGMALGLLVGMVPLPLPGGGSFALGVAGGPLVTALVLGWVGRTGPIGWRMPVVANLVLRNLGLSIFIGVVAIGAGEPFARTVTSNGVPIPAGWCRRVAHPRARRARRRLRTAHSVRRSARYMRRRHRQSGDPRAAITPGTDRPAGTRLRDQLSERDDREDHRRAAVCCVRPFKLRVPSSDPCEGRAGTRQTGRDPQGFRSSAKRTRRSARPSMGSVWWRGCNPPCCAKAAGASRSRISVFEQEALRGTTLPLVDHGDSELTSRPSISVADGSVARAGR